MVKPTIDEMAEEIGRAMRASVGAYQTCTPTAEEKYALEVARVGFMASCPFYAHYFYSEMKEVFTYDIPTAATDGRNIFINPKYVAGLKLAERVFVYAHEVDHVICRHPQRAKHYRSEKEISGKPFDHDQANVAMDYVINAGLLEQGVGQMNPSWCYDPNTTGEDLWEEVYVRHYKDKPPGQGGGSTFGGSGKGSKGAKGDGQADAAGGRFDNVLDPAVDPVTGKEDIPTEAEFKEAIARAAGAAKAMGKFPGSLQRRVAEILEPQIDWREHVRMLLTGTMGARHETWNRLNRRYAALGALSSRPIPQFPGRRGFGAGTVVCVVDNSGSISEKELSAFFAEVGGVLADVRPKKVILMWCDAEVRQVDEARSLDELQHIRAQGSPGGGGTNFRPPFDYVEREGIVPDQLIYITDMMGCFPDEKPGYPVMWCKTTDYEAPWGEQVRIKV